MAALNREVHLGLGMALRKTERSLEHKAPLAEVGSAAWRQAQGPALIDNARQDYSAQSRFALNQSQSDALQTLLSFAALHEQLNKRKALARHADSNGGLPVAHLDEGQRFTLDEVLQLVAERAVAITGADGSAIALAEEDEIVMRAAAGTVRPETGARIDSDSAFSRACFRMAQTVSCDDTETDERVNLRACRSLGARSMVAVPLFGGQRVIGLLETFSTLPFGFSDGDVFNLKSLAELVHGALRSEDEDRFAESSQIAVTKLEPIADRTNAICATGMEVQDEPPVESEEASAPEPRVAADSFRTPARPEESKRVTRRSDILVLLLSMAIVAVLAGGALWKSRRNRLSNGVVQTEKVQTHADSQTAPSLSSSMVGSAAKRSAVSHAGSSPNSRASRKNLSTFSRVTGIQHSFSGESSTVVFELDHPVQYEVHRLANPARIYFDLHDTELGPALAEKSINVGDALLKRIRVAQLAVGTARIVLETKVLSDFSVRIEPNPYRLVVEVLTSESSAQGTR